MISAEMQHLTELAIDPFLRQAELASARRTKQALAKGAAASCGGDSLGIAGGPWAPCTTCSDPGPDNDQDPPRPPS